MPGHNYDAAYASLQVARAAGTACYEHSQARTPIERAVSARLAPAFRNLPRGLCQFTPEALGWEDATYLRVDTGGPNGGFSNGARLVLTRIGFAWNEQERRSVDLDTGADLGEVNRWSFTRDGEPDWMKYGDQTKRPVWREIRYRDFLLDHRIFAAILPMSGPLLERHPAIAHLATVAGTIWRREAAEFQAMSAHDREMDRLCGLQTAAKEECRRLALRSMDVEAIAAAHPELAAEIRGMDWTYDYADRACPRMREREMRIRSGLSVLPIDDALALFVSLGSWGWDYFASYLCRHPYVLGQERPAAVRASNYRLAA